MGNESESLQFDHAKYLEERRLLLSNEMEAARSFDQWLLTLSGGALGLSLTFLNDIVGPNGAVHHWAIITAWLTYAACCALVLFSWLTTQRAHEKFRAVLDREFAAYSPDVFNRIRERQDAVLEAHVVPWLNRLGIFTFVVATVFLSVFVALNL